MSVSRAQQLIESGNASPELIAAYNAVQGGEYDGVIKAHKARTKRAQTRERVRRLRERRRNPENAENAESALPDEGVESET